MSYWIWTRRFLLLIAFTLFFYATFVPQFAHMKVSTQEKVRITSLNLKEKIASFQVQVLQNQDQEVSHSSSSSPVPWTFMNVMNASDIEYVENNLNSLDQTDIRLIQYTRIKYISPPSTLPYSLKRPVSKNEFSEWVVNFFGGKRGGIFIECGGNDGELMSNTLYLEKQLGWSGLLIECNPAMVQELEKRHRKVWISNVCVSLGPTPRTYTFKYPRAFPAVGVIHTNRVFPQGESQNQYPPDVSFQVQAVPLYTILASIGLKEVDFVSFDTEGTELAVLRSFPFEKVMIKVILIEVIQYKPNEVEELNALMMRNNYTLAKKFNIGRPYTSDHFYVHKSVENMIQSPEKNIFEESRTVMYCGVRSNVVFRAGDRLF